MGLIYIYILDTDRYCFHLLIYVARIVVQLFRVASRKLYEKRLLYIWIQEVHGWMDGYSLDGTR